MCRSDSMLLHRVLPDHGAHHVRAVCVRLAACWMAGGHAHKRPGFERVGQRHEAQQRFARPPTTPLIRQRPPNEDIQGIERRRRQLCLQSLDVVARRYCRHRFGFVLPQGQGRVERGERRSNGGVDYAVSLHTPIGTVNILRRVICSCEVCCLVSCMIPFFSVSLSLGT